MTYQLIGWTGTVLFIISYGLLSIHKIHADKLLYQGMNALAALCLVINAIHIGDNPTYSSGKIVCYCCTFSI